MKPDGVALIAAPRLTEEEREARRIETRGAARAFVEDMEHIREVIAREKTSSGEIRRLSAILRRLLVDGTPFLVALPRFEGRLQIDSPDRQPIYVASRSTRLLFYSSGGSRIFGIYFEMMALWNAGQIDPWQLSRQTFLQPMRERRVVSFKVSNFMAQKVLCYRGVWATREQVIKHIANYGSGVHDKTPVDDVARLLEQMRSACVYGVRDGVVFAHVMPELGENGPRFKFDGEPPRDFNASDIDALLVEVLATARFLADSPNVRSLEEIVWRELEALRPSSE